MTDPRLPPTCPRCGAALEWEIESVTNGLDPEWLHRYAADCSCGLSLEIRPEGQASMWPRVDPAPADDLFLAALRT